MERYVLMEPRATIAALGRRNIGIPLDLPHAVTNRASKFASNRDYYHHKINARITSLIALTVSTATDIHPATAAVTEIGIIATRKLQITVGQNDELI
jgi:hypothetical protein